MREKLIELLNNVQDYGTKNTYEEHSITVESKNNETVADALIANGVTIQKWIPVTERLPEEDVRVLVWLGTGDITYTQIDTDRLHKKKWRRWTKNVTHWMPLPEPPAIDK